MSTNEPRSIEVTRAELVEAGELAAIPTADECAGGLTKAEQAARQ